MPAAHQRVFSFLRSCWVACALWQSTSHAAPGDPAHFETFALPGEGPKTTLCLARRAGSVEKHPVILTMGSFKAGGLPEWSTNLVRDGFMVVAFSVEHPPDPDPQRRPVWLYFDERFAHSYVLGGVRTPADVARVIDHLVKRPDVDGQRIGWLGSSTTGIFGLAAATREPRIKAVVGFVATGAYERWLETWKPNGLWRSGDHDLWPETRALLPEADPVRRATNLFPCAVLLVNGGADKVVDVSSTRAFIEAARPAYTNAPERLRLVVYEGMGHNLPADVVQMYSEHWFRLFLDPSKPPPTSAAGPSSLRESTRRTALTDTPHEKIIAPNTKP